MNASLERLRQSITLLRSTKTTMPDPRKKVLPAEKADAVNNCDLRWNQQQHGESVGSTVHASPNPRNGLKVLVVEDSIVNQKLAVAMLKKLGHEVAIANNGKEALEAIKQSVFDLVLMDIQMPELDGYETVRQLRKDETDERLPVIALTANAMRTDREACLQAGMDAYVSKPIRLKKLAEIIQEVCFAK